MTGFSEADADEEGVAAGSRSPNPKPKPTDFEFKVLSIFELGGSGTLLVLGFGASILNVHSGFLSFELLELVLVLGFYS